MKNTFDKVKLEKILRNLYTSEEIAKFDSLNKLEKDEYLNGFGEFIQEYRDIYNSQNMPEMPPMPGMLPDDDLKHIKPKKLNSNNLNGTSLNNREYYDDDTDDELPMSILQLESNDLDNNINQAQSLKSKSSKSMSNNMQNNSDFDGDNSDESGEESSDNLQNLANNALKMANNALKMANNAQQAADKAQQAADKALQAANLAMNNASLTGSQEALNSANLAQQAANKAQQAADRALQAAKLALEMADKVLQAANKALEIANNNDNINAQDEINDCINDAIENAKNARNSSNDAINDAKKSLSNSKDAKKASNSANNSANNSDNIDSDNSDLENEFDEANNNIKDAIKNTDANTALQTANLANKMATLALQVADKAQEYANEIKNKAAQTNDSSMQEAADKAQEAADKAQEAANNAQEAASKAQESANKAQEAANNGNNILESESAVDAAEHTQDAISEAKEALKLANKAKNAEKNNSNQKNSNSNNIFDNDLRWGDPDGELETPEIDEADMDDFNGQDLFPDGKMPDELVRQLIDAAGEETELDNYRDRKEKELELFKNNLNTFKSMKQSKSAGNVGNTLSELAEKLGAPFKSSIDWKLILRTLFNSVSNVGHEDTYSKRRLAADIGSALWKGRYLKPNDMDFEENDGITQVFYLIDNSGSMGFDGKEGQIVLNHLFSEILEIEEQAKIANSAIAYFSCGEIKRKQVRRWTKGMSKQDRLKIICRHEGDAAGGTSIATALKSVLKLGLPYFSNTLPRTILIGVTDGYDDYSNLRELLSGELKLTVIMMIVAEDENHLKETAKIFEDAGVPHRHILIINTSNWKKL